MCLQDMADDVEELTGLLQAWSNGDEEALARLMPRVYEELRDMASRHMAGERAAHPLQSTALIHEAYLRLAAWDNVRWKNRAHFFAVAAQMMRRVLVDIARTRDSARRGGHVNAITFDEAFVFQPERARILIELENAMIRLAELDQRKTRIVELRFFGGLTLEETALVLQLSDRTVLREWNLAKAWLYKELRSK